MQAFNFNTIVPECSAEVLDSMFFALVSGVQCQPAVELTAADDPSFCCSLWFRGDICGCFGLQVPQSVARSLTANFLGAEESILTEAEIQETTEELANMLCGSVMSRVEGEHKFVLSHPAAGGQPPFGLAKAFTFGVQTDLGRIAIWIAVEGVPCPS